MRAEITRSLCLTPVRFKPLLNLRSFVFGLNVFCWSIYINFKSLVLREYHFSFRPFLRKTKKA